MRNFRDVPLPPLMQHLPRDPRGYPIPDNVFRGADGKPHFTINDTHKRLVHLRENRCPICGNRLNAGYWFVGGPMSAFHEHGLYLDLPMHHQCMRYAIQVCPYLAMPSYQGRIEHKTLKPQDRQTALLFIDDTMMRARPEVFVSVLSKQRQLIRGGEYIRPVKPYKKVEFWKDGEQLSYAEGRRIADEALARELPKKMRPPRLLG